MELDKLGGQSWWPTTLWRKGGGGGRVSYREGLRVQEGDLGWVEIDVAGGLCRVEFGPHELWQVCRHRDTPHVASSFVWSASLLGESLCWCWETQLACELGIIPAGTPDDIITQAGTGVLGDGKIGIFALHVHLLLSFYRVYVFFLRVLVLSHSIIERKDTRVDIYMPGSPMRPRMAGTNRGTK